MSLPESDRAAKEASRLAPVTQPGHIGESIAFIADIRWLRATQESVTAHREEYLDDSNLFI